MLYQRNRTFIVHNTITVGRQVTNLEKHPCNSGVDDVKSTKFAIFRRIFREIFRLGCYSSSYSMLGLVRGRSGISVRRNC